jgi:hypothetical protein
MDFLNDDVAELHSFATRRNAGDPVKHGYKVHGDGTESSASNHDAGGKTGAFVEVGGIRSAPPDVGNKEKVKQPKGEHDPNVAQDGCQDEGDARHECQAAHGDHGDGVDVPATTPPTDSLPKILPNW